jgi:N-methylhydantoinase A
MVETAKREMVEEGFAEDQIEILRTADVRFQGQAYELTLPMPARDLTADDAQTLFDEFLSLYEKTYGEGTAWKGVPASMINYSVTAVGRQPTPDLEGAELDPADPEKLIRERRTVFLPGERSHEEVPVYEDGLFTAGTAIEGPAIIDAADTTVYVPPGTRAERDQFMNYVLTR